MPSDSRRLAVPEISINPCLYKKESKNFILTKDGARKDGRKDEELRDLFVKCGLVSEATGSAYCEIGNNKVVCAVHGPKDIEQKEDYQMDGKVVCEVKFAPFSCQQRKEHIPSSEENELSEMLTEAMQSVVCLDKFPKSQIEIYVIILDNGGSAMSAVFMAASFALADASIDTYDILTACSVRVIGKDLFLVDPDQIEEDLENLPEDFDASCNALVTVAVLPTLNQVSALSCSGIMTSEVLAEATDLCVNSAQSRYMTMRECLQNTLKSTNNN